MMEPEVSMLTVGAQEMVVIFLVALVLFGPKKLPELGRTIGKALTEFRRAQSELKSTFETHMRELEKETESLKTAADSYTKDIYNYYTEGDTAYPGSTPAVEAAATPLALPAAQESLPDPAPAEAAKPAIEPAAGTVPRNGTSENPHEVAASHPAEPESHSISG
jgi:sec-independent protein translocase protein TatA